MPRTICWFSCGANSAVMTKLALHIYQEHEIRIARCVIDNEHPDNERFHRDCEAWYNRPIERLKNSEYLDCWDVWRKFRYMSGVKGAPCTAELKKAVRWDLEKTFKPDYQIFGFSFDEQKREQLFKENNPEVKLLSPLIDLKITKPQCQAIIREAGIVLPKMYSLGFKNNNCIGCVKSSSPAYWARIRHFFPSDFAITSDLAREVGCRLLKLKGERIFLDELPQEQSMEISKNEQEIECGILCDFSEEPKAKA